ncbi:hypothetical protein [Paenibacillus flagellatus]|uniref:Uncharacterized protein n=1 Tax=Paenibacillus flagellatus TaxID=2211139 RepID=A0A2V5K8V1_9BACL|nr:hypothetical protein [Paenibacillus flagellatus]PYI55931.1 hypothetical protein DLM86_09490 [Paenibacillus flagellatus]
MGRLKKFAKKSKEEYHQYPWKVDYELFAFFSKYCESLNLSVNEGLSLLVGDEIESYKQELTPEEQEEILAEFRQKKGIFLREGPPACVHPGMPQGAFPPRGYPPEAPPHRGRPPRGARGDTDQD